MTDLCDPIFGQVASVQSPQGTVSYHYNNSGQLTGLYTPSTIEKYAYDQYGRLSSVSMQNASRGYGGIASNSGALVTNYGYDAAGNKISETDASGSYPLQTTYTYDDLNRLVGVNLAGKMIQAYTLNDDGTRRQLVETTSGDYGNGTNYRQTVTTLWSYDALQRLTGETLGGQVINTRSNGTTLSVAQVNGYNDSYTYDLDNNRLTKTHVGPGGGSSDSLTYMYNGDDQLVQQTSNLTGTTSFGYDFNGSMMTSAASGAPGQVGTNTTTYGYDVRNRMVKFTAPSTGSGQTGAMTYYVYDDNGNRVSEVVGGTQSYYLTDTNNPTGYSQPLEVKSSMTAAPSATYELGDAVVAQCDSSGNVQFLMHDGHGSTRLLVDNTTFHAVIASYNYDAFGNALNFNPGTAGTPFLYAGDSVQDAPSGLRFYANGVRDVWNFVYIERDVPGWTQNQNPLTLNLHLLDDANPTNQRDPNGHMGLQDTLATIGAGASIDAEGAGIASAIYQEAQAIGSLVTDQAQLIGQLAQAVMVNTSSAVVTAAIDCATGFAEFVSAVGSTVGSFTQLPAMLSGGIAVIGPYLGGQGYTMLGTALNAPFFSVPADEWATMSPEEQWAANVDWLNQMAAAGRSFVISVGEAGPSTLREIAYLTGLGYTRSDDVMVPPGGS